MSSFAKSIIQWNQSVDRNLPWKKDKDPYKIWLSEIILQQTRVDQGSPYFLKFTKLFPTIKKLASANEDDIMKAWQGLGYYSRARNLLITAKYIVSNHKGCFPDSYEEILKLKGVGQYTASAIASFAFDLPYAAIDGNVLRVMTRYLGITEPAQRSAVKNVISTFLNSHIVKTSPALFNQALIDLGSLICTPKRPDCLSCPIQKTCLAFAKDLIDIIPNKAKSIQKKDRYFHYFIIQDKMGHVLIRKRTEKDIWTSLYEFPLIECSNNKKLSKNAIKTFLEKIALKGVNFTMINIVIGEKHLLSHQAIYATYYLVKMDYSFQNKESNYNLVIRKNLMNFAFPRMIDKVLDELNSKMY